MRTTIYLLPLLGFLLAGCFPNPVEEIRQHVFQPGTTLEQAYDSILDNVAWEKIKVDGATVVEVRGIIKGTTESLVVRYESKPRPPVVHSFQHNGKEGNATEFSTVLYRLHLHRAIMESPGAGA